MLRTFALLLTVAFLGLNLVGCAASRPAALDDLPPPLQLDDRVLLAAPDHVTPSAEFGPVGTGAGVKAGMAEGALGGAAGGLRAGLESGLILFPPAAAVLVGGGAVLGTLGGAVVGGFQAASAAEVQCVTAGLAAALEDARLNETLALELQRHLKEFSNVDLPIEEEVTEPVDALCPKLLFIEVDGQRLGDDERTVFVLKATLLRRKSDGTVRSFGNIEHLLRPRPLAQWCGLGSAGLRQELRAGITELARQMSDLLLVARELDRPSTRECPSWRGLAPVSPPVMTGLLGQALPAAVASLRPELSWEPFPRLVDMASAPLVPAVAGAVVYDLRVWQFGKAGDLDRTLVYARTGLRETSHRIAIDLRPGTRYAWEVRPRFYLEGVRRTLPWSRLTYDVEACTLAAGVEMHYTFETPAAVK